MEENKVKKAVENYIKKLQEHSDNYYKTELPNVWELKQAPKFKFNQGKRWIKITRVAPAENSVFCFINPETGDIYKAAGFNAPAKGIRGNVFKDNLPLTSGALYRVR